jgi:uncharacterized membrane protein YdjX (TVP38/TMEM64 family)
VERHSQPGLGLGEDGVDGLFANIDLWLAELGTWAYIVAPAVMAGVSILPLPAEAPAMANGIIFGTVVGTAITWVGAMAGAWISYELARAYGRPVARRVVNPSALKRIEHVADSAGWWGLLVLRLVPVVAFTALNWGAGLCGLPRRRFLWTTAVGIIPGTILFTSSGVGLGALYRRSPPLAGALTLAIVAGMVVWTLKRRRLTDPTAGPS